MKYTDMLRKEKIEKINKIINEIVEITEVQNGSAEELLRKKNIKIKLVTKTAFGTQIDFMKKYEEDVISEILKDFNLKFKNNSVFIVN